MRKDAQTYKGKPMLENEISAIPATTGTASTRVDGTIVLKVEIQPYNKEKWMQLLGTEAGVPIAIARMESN